jgi:hypothetical protein
MLVTVPLGAGAVAQTAFVYSTVPIDFVLKSDLPNALGKERRLLVQKRI